MVAQPAPLIVAFVADLYFASRIESTAERLGALVSFVERASQLWPPDAQEASAPEALRAGLGARRPAFLIFDLNNSEIPWEDWIVALRADSAWGDVPVVAFGSHVETDTLRRARAAGAEPVLARSRFVTTLPEILAKALAPGS